MGSSLSRQEQLFLDRQWPELLEAAISADTESLADAGDCDDDDDGGAGTAAAHHSSRSARTKKSTGRGSRDGFRLSFQEWQSFLSVLELRGATGANSAPSDICAALALPQMHVPAVVLLVHLCVWWRGAISSAVLSSRLEGLVHLVSRGSAPRETGAAQTPPTGSGAGSDTAAGRDGHAADGGTEDGAGRGRRARLARFVKERLVERSKRSPGPSSSSGAAAAVDAEDLSLDTFADLACLVQHLVCQDGEPPVLSDVAGSAASAVRIFDLYDAKISNAEALKQRPVLAVVMVLVLAVYASRARAHPELAVRSVAHLEALETLMTGGGGPTASPASALTTLWPLTAELEVALAHRQHEADALRCAGGDGDVLHRTLQQMRQSRLSLPPDGVAGGAATPSERWAAGASQYVGQRHIWTALRTHFLSAGVFDADKPTVLVFFGPSGYGKSELAKRVASVLHGVPMSQLEASGKMVYIHMPSFCTKDSIYSLVDPPAAHVGSGILLSALQQHPDAVVVLDEFEKSTAEAINNLWLSAFQKNGVLRSLKEASRSVSTVRTTFILTCNIAADSIAAREGLYLAASPVDQEKIRLLFQSQCKSACQAAMGDPFVNRVDFFFPFMPYTLAERRHFVCLLLERLLTSQAEKGRTIHATPGFVQAMVERLHSFHAATLEEAVRMQVVRMAREGWTSGVLTAERRIGGGTVAVLLPATASEDTTRATAATTAAAARCDDADDDRSGRSLCVEAWDSLPGGSESLAQWTAPRGERAPPAAADHGAAAPSPAIPPPSTLSADRRTAGPAAATACGATAEKAYEYEYTVDKLRIRELEKELEATRAVVTQRDVEIATLKEKVVLLQKALALLLVSLLGCLCLVALLVGLKLTLLFAAAVAGCLIFVLGVPLSLLLDAVRGLFHLLGPAKACGLLVLALAWLIRASRSAASCA
ncbi:AAA domain (Cdc48 subfamily)/AAA domain (dynein-related subfamily) [Novymonas esmeraldas]|uniref:AAA domain (Cdc48 subfamily)/AAA domain (Dynein-related subfamily) n=1 Tax=Novymonas esmeraldas TaxID=1808958 RepID=A0AAW0F5V9_9TRYP